MKHYKSPDNSLHFIEPEFAFMLPAGCVEITDEEAEALRPQPDPKDAIKAQIAALEAQITPRRLREALISGNSDFIIGIDAEISVLRSQL